jgi:hypothetical protein
MVTFACERMEVSVRYVFASCKESNVQGQTYPSGTAVAVNVLLEALDAFVQVVVVVGPDINENSAAEDLSQVFGVGPVVRNVVGEVEGPPVFDGFGVNFAGDLVPGLATCGLVCLLESNKQQASDIASYLKWIAV